MCQKQNVDAHLFHQWWEITCSLEYLNKNWTYHSKGLWLFPKQSNDALVTIGSPNFGMRSYFRDMESQLYMVSESEHYILA